jgi:hypothetical protein
MNTFMAGLGFGPRWQSAAATALLPGLPWIQNSVARRLPPQSKFSQMPRKHVRCKMNFPSPAALLLCAFALNLSA